MDRHPCQRDVGHQTGPRRAGHSAPRRPVEPLRQVSAVIPPYIRRNPAGFSPLNRTRKAESSSTRRKAKRWFIMQTVTNQPAQPATAAAHNLQAAFPPLEQVTRSHVPTDQAAYYLMRRPQTMRAYACLENGPIRPIRINGRLAWNVAEIKSLLTRGAK